MEGVYRVYSIWYKGADYFPHTFYLILYTC